MHLAGSFLGLVIFEGLSLEGALLTGSVTLGLNMETSPFGVRSANYYRLIDPAAWLLVLDDGSSKREWQMMVTEYSRELEGLSTFKGLLLECAP